MPNIPKPKMYPNISGSAVKQVPKPKGGKKKGC